MTSNQQALNMPQVPAKSSARHLAPQSNALLSADEVVVKLARAAIYPLLWEQSSRELLERKRREHQFFYGQVVHAVRTEIAVRAEIQIPPSSVNGIVELLTKLAESGHRYNFSVTSEGRLDFQVATPRDDDRTGKGSGKATDRAKPADSKFPSVDLRSWQPKEHYKPC
jgi:hypothetical protein